MAGGDYHSHPGKTCAELGQVEWSAVGRRWRLELQGGREPPDVAVGEREREHQGDSEVSVVNNWTDGGFSD